MTPSDSGSVVRRSALRRAVDRYSHAFAGFTGDAKAVLWAFAVQNAGVGVLTTVFALYVKEIGLSESVVGGSEGLLSTTAGLACVVVPPLFAAIGYRTMFLFGAATYFVARAGQAISVESMPIFAFALAAGLGDGVGRAGLPAFYSEHSDVASRSYLFSVDFASRVGASAVGAVIGGVLPALLRGSFGDVVAYRVTVLFAALLFAVSMIPLARVRDRSHSRLKSMRARGLVVLREFSSWGHLGGLLAIQTVIGFGAGAIMPFVSLFLRHRAGASILEIGVIQGIYPLWMALAVLASPFFARRFGGIKSIVVAQAASLPFLAAVPFVRSLWPLAVVLWVRGALMNMSWPVFNEHSMTAVPAREKPLVAGWLAAGFAAGNFLGAVIGGRIMEGSYTVPYFIATAAYGVAVLLQMAILRERRGDPDESAATA